MLEARYYSPFRPPFLPPYPPDPPARRQCLDAFAIALNHVCGKGKPCCSGGSDSGGGPMRWYASTLNLQLASLDLCRTCRSVATLHILVEDGTPYEM